MADVTLADKVAFLSRPDTYRTRQVEVKETHMSWIFLTETEAWKLKKPVRTAHLDFSTIATRERNCALEVQLNQRLAADVYLGIVPLTLNPSGALRLGGTGDVVDWLVKMRRLPAARMLDCAIAQHTVKECDACSIGKRLAHFYQQAPQVSLTAAEYRQQLRHEISANQHELSQQRYGLPLPQIASITQAQRQFLIQQAALFDERIRSGRIIEAHGDLRPEHICLEKPPVIIDCLEFNRTFRILDVAAELAFLALECERLGAAKIGEHIQQCCCGTLGDAPPASLLAFYRSHHACLRAKIAVWHLADCPPQETEKWTNKAKQYLQFAAAFTSSATAL